jgi:hypothetical protein
MNFLITPEGELVLNSVMDEIEQEAAGRFIDELIALGILLPAQGPLLANCPLFCVDKANQPGQKRCIADMKRGGQNACIGKDPVYLSQKETILPRLYPGGYSAVADASKQFHNFKTKPSERQYLGCIHPVTGEQYVWAGLPMGAANSPAISCRITNSALRMIREREPVFQGTIDTNTWKDAMAGDDYDPRKGHGRILMGPDGLPAALLWVMVDDYLVHAPTKKKCCQAFSAFMDHMLRMGFICQPIKTSPPKQVQKFCGMLFDTTGAPTIRIPEEKISRARATIDYVRALNDQGVLSRLTAAVMGGLLQSLVEGTPSRQGQTYLRRLYDNIHHTTPLFGKPLYYTKVILGTATLDDLQWWDRFLQCNPGNTSRAGHMGTLGVTWGDGSGTGTGGTLEEVQHLVQPEIETWMGTWAPRVGHFDSNWRELRTLLWTLERQQKNPSGFVRGGTLFYFTDNLVSYYVVHNGSSTSPALHELVRRIKLLEIELGCRVEPVHVPGKLMIIQGTDGLSRGMWISPDRLLRSSVEESRMTLEPVPFTPVLGVWALRQLGLSSATPYVHHSDKSDWSWKSIGGSTTIWTPSPEVGRQALAYFLDYWVENATETDAIFLIPRVLQRDWGYLSKHIHEIGTFSPCSLPWGCRYDSLIPFCLLYCPRYTRCLPPPVRLEPAAPACRFERWHQAQAEYVRGL